MKFFNSLCLLLLPLIFFSGCKSQASGYSIRVNLKGCAPGDSLFLGRFENSRQVKLQTASVASGKSVLTGNRPLRPGMYAAGISGKDKFDFLISDTLNQHFNISVEKGNIPSTLTFENSPENVAFTEYQRFLDECNRQQKALQLQMRHNNWSPDSVNKINSAFMKLNKGIENRAETLQKEFPGSMLALYIGLIREPQVPEPVIPGTVTDHQQFMQEYYFNYLSGHFFDNFNFSDPRIISIPVFEEKTGFYFRQLVPPLPDSAMVKVGTLLEKAGQNEEVYNFIVKYLYRLFRESPVPEFMQVSNLIGEAYIITDPDRWKDSPFVEKVSERIAKARLNAIGTVATNLKLQKNTGETILLSDVKVNLTILYFFNPECDACGPITDQLYTIYNKFKNRGAEVFAVYLDRKEETWKKYIDDKKLDWLNGYDPTGAEMIETKYDIYAIPMIYLLDGNKRVIAKDVPVEKLEGYLQNRM
jgi:peroxiredoxin